MCQLDQHLALEKANLKKIVFNPNKILQFLNIGRVVRLIDGNIDWGYGISINFHQKNNRKNKN